MEMPYSQQHPLELCLIIVLKTSYFQLEVFFKSDLTFFLQDMKLELSQINICQARKMYNIIHIDQVFNGNIVKQAVLWRVTWNYASIPFIMSLLSFYLPCYRTLLLREGVPSKSLKLRKKLHKHNQTHKTGEWENEI